MYGNTLCARVPRTYIHHTTSNNNVKSLFEMREAEGDLLFFFFSNMCFIIVSRVFVVIIERMLNNATAYDDNVYNG